MFGRMTTEIRAKGFFLREGVLFSLQKKYQDAGECCLLKLSKVFICRNGEEKDEA
jgi:hypothetical protein